jgi:Fur family ferric uptake transcriptional regulator
MPTAPHREEHAALAAHLAAHRLKRSAPREVILDAFLKARHHLSVEELLRVVRRRHPEVGRTTVYRTLRLFTEAGLASELLLGGEARFEPIWKREHHDHFVCRRCGEIFEFVSPEIERLQQQIAAGIGFSVEGHRHLVFGLCRSCASRAEQRARARPPWRVKPR